jgi:hypothetical protein
MTNLDYAIDAAKTAIEGVKDGSLEVPKGDVLVRGSYSIVKAEETRLRAQVSGHQVAVIAQAA